MRFSHWPTKLALLLIAFAPSANSLDSCVIPHGETKSINEHSVCRQVTNNHASGKSILVPTKTDAEWSTGAKAFINAPPPGVSLAACSGGCSATLEATLSGISGTVHSFASDGDTVVIGQANYDPGGYASRGIAYVYVRSGSTFTLQATLAPADTPAVAGNGPGFGNAVAISGDTIAVGASAYDNGSGSTNRDFGAVYIFTRSGTTWTQQQRIVGGGATGNTEAFGRGVAIHGDRFIASTNDEDGDGSVRIYKRTGTTWAAESPYLTVGHEILANVSIHGDTALACHSEYNTTYGGTVSNQGAIRVYQFNGTSWVSSILKLPSPVANDNFCADLDIDGDTIVGAARRARGAATNAGALFVFKRSGSTWSQEAMLQPADLATSDFLGYAAIRLSGDTLVASAHTDTGATDAGSVYVFSRDGTTWTQVSKILSPSPVASALLRPVGISGDRIYTLEGVAGAYSLRSWVLSCGGASCQ